MTKKSTRQGKADDLRERAENAVRMQDTTKTLSPDEVQQALHELRVHQIELEMQNEELRRTQKDLEASRERYFDL
jgi:DNA repair exonuclease SbcCD ATPase subunit